MGALRVAVVLEQCWHRVPGGTASSALRSVEAVARTGAVDQIGVSAWHRRPPPPPWVPSVPVRSLRLERRLLYESWHHARWPAVQRATGPVDVIHATGFAVPPRTAPLVVTVHDLAWKHRPEHFSRRGVRFFRDSLELTRRRADAVVCPSEASAADVVAAGVGRERISVVPWGVDQRRASPTETERVRRAWRLDRPYVLWLGTIEPRKNLSVLFEAFARLERPDLDLVLAGPSGWHESLPDRSSRVRTLGFVPASDLPALYAGAEAFCYPSLLEGFGLPVLEAMAQGTPVVTSRGTATEEVLGPGGRSVDPTRPDEVSEALDEVMRRRAALSERARAQATRFPWSRTAEALVTVYQQVAGA